MPRKNCNPSHPLNKPVKHHHVNKAYLEEFCLPNGELFQYLAAMAMRSPAALDMKAKLDPLIKAGYVKGDYRQYCKGIDP